MKYNSNTPSAHPPHTTTNASLNTHTCIGALGLFFQLTRRKPGKSTTNRDLSILSSPLPLLIPFFSNLSIVKHMHKRSILHYQFPCQRLINIVNMEEGSVEKNCHKVRSNHTERSTLHVL